MADVLPMDYDDARRACNAGVYMDEYSQPVRQMNAGMAYGQPAMAYDQYAMQPQQVPVSTHPDFARQYAPVYSERPQTMYPAGQFPAPDVCMLQEMLLDEDARQQQQQQAMHLPPQIPMDAAYYPYAQPPQLQQEYAPQYHLVSPESSPTPTPQAQAYPMPMDATMLDDSKPVKQPSSRICRIPGCTKGIRSRGLCKGHGGGRRCQTPGCTISDQGGGHCIAHGGGKRCMVEGCDKSAQYQGRCKVHGGSRRCRMPDCPKNGQVKGLCRLHYSQSLRQAQAQAQTQQDPNQVPCPEPTQAIF